MAQRHMCPSMGALRRSLVADVALASRCSIRAFHSSPQTSEEQPSGAAAPPAAAPPSRKDRSATALKQITNLQNRRAIPAGGLGRGNFPGGPMAKRNPRAPQADESGFIPENTPSNAQPTSNRRFPPRSGAAPPGQMVRAPSQLRITRVTGSGGPGGPGGPDRPGGPGGMRGPNPRGPNLRARDGNRGPGGPGGARGGTGGSRGGDKGPKKRERKQGGGGAQRLTTFADVNPATTLSDGMVHHLLRLQRQEWDRVPYEPKYGKDSFAANELTHVGRELFKGESAPVKIWGPLEKRIGVVGMFGAEATLKIRRVRDGEPEAFDGDALEAEQATATKAQKKPVV